MPNHEVVLSQETTGPVFETIKPDGSGDVVSAVRYIEVLGRLHQIVVNEYGEEKPVSRVVEGVLYED